MVKKMKQNFRKPEKPNGKLGVLIVGLGGAVATTFLAGTLAVRKKMAEPFGSITQMATIRLGKRSENRFPLIKDLVPLADLNDLIFGGWDIRYENCYEAALIASVLEEKDLNKVKDELEKLYPMKGVFEQRFVTRLKASWIKSAPSKYDYAQMLRNDIRDFKAYHELDRVVVIWCASTEIYSTMNGVHQDLEHFEEALKNNHPDIAPSMIYAYAALSEKVPFIMGAPNLSVDIPALVNYSKEQGVPIAGKDFKTGQTLMKTVLAPMLKAKMLGLTGWFSSNILGNRDGEVLDNPDNFKTKEECKLSVLEGILQPDLYPKLYGNYYHKVRIHYYPPRKDNKEGWDNIDIFGWLGYPMQLKVNFLCRDSILAAPLALDLVLFMDLANRIGWNGIQNWLSFYFKGPIHEGNIIPEHDVFIQLMKLKNTLRNIVGEELITHLDQEANADIDIEKVIDYL
jgi:myo-inositol-1-phosphate synthase